MTAGERQYEEFRQIARSIGGGIEVVGNHRSKSVDLPVVRISVKWGEFRIRNNFYDYNLLVDWIEPPSVLLSDLYQCRDFGWYQNEIDKKRNYTYKAWTDEEMADPRILRVWKGNRWSEVTGLEKDRWSRRLESTEWYSKDWSSTHLIREGDRFYEAPHAFAEGMEAFQRFQPYSPGDRRFLLCIGSVDRLKAVMKKVCNG